MSTVRIQVRRGTASEWTSANPTLAAGELGVETDTRKIKVGSGSTAWTSLSYIAADSPSISEIAQDAINDALSMGSGLTKSYNDGTNTISLNIDSSVVALRSYVDDEVNGLTNTVQSDYVLLSDVGNAGGPAKLDVDGNLLIPKSSIILEGSSADAYETTLTVTNPTADRTITFPNATGTVALITDIEELAQDAVNSAFTTGSGITKVYDDGANTITIGIDTGYIATTEALRSVLSSLNYHQAVEVATTASLNATYAAGSADQAGGTGIGATLTMNANGAISIDGVALDLNSRVLVKDQANQLHNGIYTVTTVGGPSAAAVLTRALDYNNSEEKTPADVAQGDVVFVITGSTNLLKQFSQIYEGTNADKSVRIGTDNIDFTQISGTATITAGDGIIKTGDELRVDQDMFLTLSVAASTYLSSANAASTYLTQTDAGTTYLTQANAGTTYLTQANAGTTYLTQANATSTYFAKNTTEIGNANISSGAAIDKTKISGTAVTQGDTATVTNAMLSGSIANDKLSNSTISGKALGTNLDTLTIGTGLTGTSYNGGAATTVAIDSTVATLTGTQTLTNKTLTSPVINTPIGLTSGDVGLANVDNTSDANKPVSSATQTALDLKAPLASPALTGVPTAPTAAAATNTTQIATTEFVRAEVAALVNSAGSTLDTLGEIATALGNDANLSTTLTNSIALKAPLDSPTFTGTVTVAAAGVAFTDGTQTKEGVPSRTPIISKTANYTLSAASERDSLIEVDSTSPVTITIPTNSAVAYPIGTTLDILGTNTGLITIAGDTGVTVNATPGLKLRTQWSSATLFKRAENSWVVYGDLKS
jgi:hypothetical protein